MASYAEDATSVTGRVPPHNLEAEQSVLGSMMLSKTAIADVLEKLRPDDFYREAHIRICQTVMDLFSSGEPVDAITVPDELERRGQLESVGGRPYVHTLVASVPHPGNAGFYAKIVAELATLRRLIDAASRISQACFDVPEDIEEMVNRAGELIYGVAAGRIHSDFRPIRELLTESMESLDRLAAHEGDVTGVPTGFRDLDSRLSGLQPQNLVLVAARPAMGKSSFVMNIAHHVSLQQQIPVVVFSLEMSQSEIVQRLICSEARVDTKALRAGRINDVEWQRVSQAVGRLDGAKLFIDDTPSITMMEIRAKCQRLKRRGELGLVIVDYIQLMTSTRRTENRVQEVSDISRSLKILAKELNVPVLAVSQLSRQPEQGGGDRRPHLAHLRECVTGDTLVVLGDGRRVPIQELVGTQPDVVAVTPKGNLTRARSDLVWCVGRRPVYTVRLATGRTMKATAEHRLLSGDGWVRIRDLRPGSRLAIARRLPEPANTKRWTDARLALLGHLIGDGSYPVHQPLRYTTSSEENSAIVSQSAVEEFGATVNRHEGRGRWHQIVISGNGNRWHPAGVNKWLRELGIYGQRSAEKRVPSAAFLLADDQIAFLIRHLWATDGTINVRSSGRRGSISFSTCSPGLAGDIAALLLRVGIVARIKQVKSQRGRPWFMVDVSAEPNQRRFLDVVGAFGPRVKPAARLRVVLDATRSNTNVDSVPREAFERVRRLMREGGISHRAMSTLRGTSYGGSSHFRFAPSRELLSEYAEILGDDELRRQATSDLFWDQVVSVESAGAEDVYDLTVPGPSCWLADGIVSHNSGALEQDADVVMFIYRDEVYNNDTPARGEAEVIVAKHRNGPTGTDKLAFLGQFTKFADLART